VFGSVETQLQCLKFSSSKMKESKARDQFWYFWLKSSLGKLGCRHIDDGVEGQRWVRGCPVRGLALPRADRTGEKGWAFPHQPHYRSALTCSKTKEKKRSGAVRQHWKGNSNSLTLGQPHSSC